MSHQAVFCVFRRPVIIDFDRVLCYISTSNVHMQRDMHTDSSRQDERFMREALREAGKARQQQEVPIGAVLVKDGEILARGYNSSITLHDPSAHAEIMVLRQAGQQVGNYRLTDTELYVTLEPCIMCMGALIQARIARLVFGAYDPRTGAAGSVFDFAGSDTLNHRFDVRGGVLEKECGFLLQDFFEQKRTMRRDGRVG